MSAVCFHPELPVILTGSEDGSVKIWHSTTYRLENTLNYGLERLWALGACRGSNLCAPCCCVLRTMSACSSLLLVSACTCPAIGGCGWR